MHHLESLIQAIPPAVFAAGSALPGDGSGIPFDSATSPLASFASSTHTYPSGVPPPSLHVFPLLNPSTHFVTTHARTRSESRTRSPVSAFRSMLGTPYPSADDLAEHTSKMSLSASYLYFDDEGYTRWQGETSGLPILDILLENHSSKRTEDPTNSSATTPHPDPEPQKDWFPNRTPRRTDVNPQTLWRLITSYIVPDLMDRYVFSCTTFGLAYFLSVLFSVTCVHPII